MAVIALNQQQHLNATAFIATFTGVAFDDAVLLCVPGFDDLPLSEATAPGFLRWLSRTGSELRLVVSLDQVPSEYSGFSFQVKAASDFARAWILTDSTGAENYQNYATPIEAGKTLELLEFGLDAGRWFIRTRNQAIGELPLPPEQSMYPEHVREIALAARTVVKADWSSVQAFVEVNEVVLGTLHTQLYLDTLAAVQGVAAAVKLRPMTIHYGEFGSIDVSPDNRVDELHRTELKAITAAGYASTKPTVEQLQTLIEKLPAGTTLVALVSTLGGFNRDHWLELLEKRGCNLMLLAMRSVPFGGLVPDFGGTSRLAGYAIANLSEATPKRILEALKS